MRPIESYLVWSAFLCGFFTLFSSSWLPLVTLPLSSPVTITVLHLLSLTTATLLLLHLIIEHPRWQFTIGYLLLLHFFSFTLPIPGRSSEPISALYSITFLIGFFVTSAIACIFPIPKFPSFPSHSYHNRVGLIDFAVPEAAELNDPIPLTVRVFYPAKEKLQSKGPRYCNMNLSRGLAHFLGFPVWFLSHLSLARLNASRNASLAEGKFPVIVFSHGLGGTAEVYSIMGEYFASLGFIVFMPTHHDESASFVELPGNGKQLMYRKLKASDNELQLRTNQLQHRAKEFISLVELLKKQSGDSWRALSPLLGKAGFNSARMDFTHLVAAGHSFGAATAVEAASRCSDIKCVVAHDIWMYPVAESVYHRGLSQPILLITSEPFARWKVNQIPVQHLASKSPNAALLVLNGTYHSNFSDIPIFSTLTARKMEQIGEIDFRIGMKRIGDLSAAFISKMTGIRYLHLLAADQTQFEESMMAERNPAVVWIERKLEKMDKKNDNQSESSHNENEKQTGAKEE